MSGRNLFFAGVDEAGRGPLAGPVVAAVVVLRQGQQIAGVRDSKKLSARRREELAELIQQQSVCWHVASASVAEIDELNILRATMLAMQRAILRLSDNVNLQQLRIDGNRCPQLPAAFAAITEPLIGGDDICPAIGAASILAKVTRDRHMRELHKEYPAYGFDRHKGYPTAAHRQALQTFGVTSQHRTSFRPVRDAVAGTPVKVANAKEGAG